MLNSFGYHCIMLKELQNRIQQHPEELLPVFKEFQQSYQKVKRLRNVDMKLAMSTLDNLIQKVHCLQRLPMESIPISLDLWTSHLTRIYNSCQKEKANIQEAFAKWSSLESNTITHHETMPEQQHDVLSPWIHDWTDQTLQSETIKRLVHDIVVPIMYPERTIQFTNVNARSRTMVVAGPSNVGKSYCIQSIHQYLKAHQQPVQWVNLTTYDCEPYVKDILDKERVSGASTKLNPKEWTVIVTDGVHQDTLESWSKETWCAAWDRHLRKRPRTLWIVLATTTDRQHINQDLFPVEYVFSPPDSKTVYHYLKKRIFQHYASADLPDKRPFPTYAYLPIVDQLPELAQFVVQFVKHRQPDFEHVEKLFYDAIQYCEVCSLNENGLFGVPTTETSAPPETTESKRSPKDTTPQMLWYPKNSVYLSKLPKTYEYRLLNHSKHDCLEWCPQTVGGDHQQCTANKITFWNIQLFDTLPFCEYDRFTQIYIDPKSITTEDNTYSVIGTFPIQSHIYPYHLQHDLEQCYEWTVAFGCGLSNYNKHRDSQDERAPQRPSRIQTTTDVLSFVDSQCAEVYQHVYPNKLVFSNVVSSSQVWYTMKKKKNTEDVPCFHISYQNKHSSKITEFVNGVPYDISASMLQKLLYVLLDAETSNPCDVVQIQTHHGYAYYINFSVPLHQAFRVSSVDRKGKLQILPQIALPTLQSGFELDEQYCMTTESDVNTLIEKYPRDYKDIYVDEEATWKLKPVRKPEHIAFLNAKYTKEQKCYMKLFSDLLRAKVAHYACLTSSQRITLDETLLDLQNHLDYLLQIIPENDHNGKWNEVWSMNKDHPQYEEYHPPEHNEVDKVISVKLATDWLRHDASFMVSPLWLKTVVFLCELYNDSQPTKEEQQKETATNDSSSVLCDITKTWQIYHQQAEQTNTQWIYIKSTVSQEFWKKAKDTSRLYEHVQQVLALPRTTLDYITLNTFHDTTKKQSLFFELFRNAEYIGVHNKHNHHIQWSTFSSFTEVDPMYPTVQALNKEPKLWMLLFKHYPEVYLNWISSTYQLSLDNLSYEVFYAHLLYHRSIHYWSLQSYVSKQSNILDDIQQQKNIDTFIRQYAFIHNQMHKQQFVLNGALPGKYERSAVQHNDTVSVLPTLSQKEKQVMTNKDKTNIRLYGLDLHHISDLFNIHH